jgi:hypothetical protein
MTRTRKTALIALAAVTLGAAVVANADPVVRPRPNPNQGNNTGERPRSGYFLEGKRRYWVFSPGAPGSDLPWLRRWIDAPHEEDVPGDPDDVGGGDLPPG